MELAEHENVNDSHVMAGLASSILDALNTLVAATRNGTITEFKRVAWNANQPVRWDTGGGAAGFMLVNESGQTCYVAQTQGGAIGAAAAGNPIGTIAVPAGGFITLPLETDVVWVGSDIAGTALILPLDAPPPPYVGASAALANAIFNTTPPTLTNGQSSPFQLDQRANLKVALTDGTGGVSEAAVTAPGDAKTAQPGLATIDQLLLFNGATWDRARVPSVFKRVNNLAIIAGTPQTIWTPAAGKKFRLMGYALTISVGSTIFLTDSGTAFIQHAGAANDQRVSPPTLGNGYLSAAANNVLQVDVGANGTVGGFVFGTEE